MLLHVSLDRDLTMIEWLTFVVIMAVGQFSPGPDMVLLTRISLAEGRCAGWAAASGIACGLMVHAGIAVSGLSLIFSKDGVSYRVVKYIACAYLLWLAYRLALSAAKQMRLKIDKTSPVASDVSLVGYWKIGFFCNILNPKVVIFLTGITLPFLGMNSELGMDRHVWAMILWVTIFLEGWVLWCLWVWLLQISMVKNLYLKRAYLFDGVFCICLIVLSFLLMVN